MRDFFVSENYTETSIILKKCELGYVYTPCTITPSCTALHQGIKPDFISQEHSSKTSNSISARENVNSAVGVICLKVVAI